MAFGDLVDWGLLVWLHKMVAGDVLPGLAVKAAISRAAGRIVAKCMLSVVGLSAGEPVLGGRCLIGPSLVASLSGCWSRMEYSRFVF